MANMICLCAFTEGAIEMKCTDKYDQDFWVLDC